MSRVLLLALLLPRLLLFPLHLSEIFRFCLYLSTSLLLEGLRLETNPSTPNSPPSESMIVTTVESKSLEQLPLEVLRYVWHYYLIRAMRIVPPSFAYGIGDNR